MNTLPKNLTLRLENIFSKEEMITLKSAFSQEKRQVSFRCNTLKSTTQEVEQALSQANITFTKLKFPKNCYLLDNNFSESDLWKRRIYKDGKIYVQGISSQVPVHFFSSLQQPSLQLSPKRGKSELQFKILDACAAPGGKTSQLSELYPNAEIYAFEPFKVRYDKMKHNLKKLWIETQDKNSLLNPLPFQGKGPTVNCINDEIRNIWKYIKPPIQLSPKGRKSEQQYFDMILVDAPCSSEWSISLHDTKFLEAWDISHINKNYKRQKHIIDDIVPYLKTWWELIYSTCTIAPEENEGVVHYALCNYPELQLQKLDFDKNKYINHIEALKKFEKYIYKTEISEKALRVIPSEYSEWFFIAKFRKWVNSFI